MIFQSKKIKIDNIFRNKRTGQLSIVLPKRKIKGTPKFVEVICWEEKNKL